MQRSFLLLNQIGDRYTQPLGSAARDVVYHFCSDAFHLRDWMAATLGTDEASTKAIRQQLDADVIRPSPELSACCDIANGFKHLTLHRRSYVTGTNQGHAEVVSQSINIGVPLIDLRLTTPIAAAVADDVRATPPPSQPTGDEGWTETTFRIDINGQKHDARNVAAKAVGAWDHWIQGNSRLARQLP